MAQSAGQRRHSGRGRREKIECIHQRRGINAARLGQRRDDPGVAALLLGLAQLAAGVPHDRMPPVQPHDHELQGADPVIAAAQVGQLVYQQRIEVLVVQPIEQARRQKQTRRSADRPEHRREAARQQADGGTSSQFEAAGQTARALPQAGWGGSGVVEQSAEALQPRQRQDKPAERAGEPDEGQHARPHWRTRASRGLRRGPERTIPPPRRQGKPGPRPVLTANARPEAWTKSREYQEAECRR